jgi:ribosomal protein S18 acetylase RimI-like enzyme
MIRRACGCDLDGINKLLFQVCRVHAKGRPDIFIDGGKKYTDSELLAIIADDSTPVFVCTDESGKVLGYAFCVYQLTEEGGAVHRRKTMYIDDLCVDEAFRGRHIGSRIYEYVLAEAKKNACDSVTLNVWELNAAARKFYEKMGLLPLKTTMEKIL